MNIHGELYKDIKNLFNKHIIESTKSGEWLKKDFNRLFSRADMKDSTTEGMDNDIVLLFRKLLLIHRRCK